MRLVNPFYIYSSVFAEVVDFPGKFREKKFSPGKFRKKKISPANSGKKKFPPANSGKIFPGNASLYQKSSFAKNLTGGCFCKKF